MHRLALPVILVSVVHHNTAANPVHGKIELPTAPERPPPTVKGFVDRVENPKKPIQGVPVTPLLLVALEKDGDTAKPESPGQVKWDLVGDSFAKPVIGAPAGAQVVIRNTSNTARTLVALEDPKLIQTGLINPKIGERSFNTTEPKIYTITDKDAPHLIGRVVVVNTPYVANVDAAGKFELDVPEGSYKLRVFFKDHWLAQTETVTVAAKGKTEPTIKIASLANPTEKAK
ncbi:MAG: hypothetical protein H0V17_03255 [Deltaproteobacteria bacterium]|nr:hypothetical protein [Deltaproteobacteria bacterium]